MNRAFWERIGWGMLVAFLLALVLRFGGFTTLGLWALFWILSTLILPAILIHFLHANNMLPGWAITLVGLVVYGLVLLTYLPIFTTHFRQQFPLTSQEAQRGVITTDITIAEQAERANKNTGMKIITYSHREERRQQIESWAKSEFAKVRWNLTHGWKDRSGATRRLTVQEVETQEQRIKNEKMRDLAELDKVRVEAPVPASSSGSWYQRFSSGKLSRLRSETVWSIIGVGLIFGFLLLRMTKTAGHAGGE